MPAANGAMSNCVKLTLNGMFQGYFPNKDMAKRFVNMYYEYYFNPFAGKPKQVVKDVKIEPWFIEGEF